jgi:hypothetical protein
MFSSKGGAKVRFQKKIDVFFSENTDRASTTSMYSCRLHNVSYVLAQFSFQQANIYRETLERKNTVQVIFKAPFSSRHRLTVVIRNSSVRTSRVISTAFFVFTLPCSDSIIEPFLLTNMHKCMD